MPIASVRSVRTAAPVGATLWKCTRKRAPRRSDPIRTSRSIRRRPRTAGSDTLIQTASSVSSAIARSVSSSASASRKSTTTWAFAVVAVPFCVLAIVIGRMISRHGDLAAELPQQGGRVLAAEEALDELRPAQRGAHLDDQPNLAGGRVPRQVRRAGRDDDRVPGAGLALLAADAERRAAGDDEVALLHLGMDVLRRPLPRPRPHDVHRQQLRRLGDDGHALAGLGVLERHLDTPDTPSGPSEIVLALVRPRR